jgi:hypothetical protein
VRQVASREHESRQNTHADSFQRLGCAWQAAARKKLATGPAGVWNALKPKPGLSGSPVLLTFFHHNHPVISITDPHPLIADNDSSTCGSPERRPKDGPRVCPSPASRRSLKTEVERSTASARRPNPPPNHNQKVNFLIFSNSPFCDDFHPVTPYSGIFSI